MRHFRDEAVSHQMQFLFRRHGRALVVPWHLLTAVRRGHLTGGVNVQWLQKVGSVHTRESRPARQLDPHQEQSPAKQVVEVLAASH